jgi:hypothetical protein
MQNDKYIYIGIFVDYDTLQKFVNDNITKDRLSRVIEKPHVTFAFRPKEYNPDLIGKLVMLKVVGYACDGKNQGLQVTMEETSNPEILAEFKKIKNPHITLSTSADGKPVDTGKMKFKPINNPFYIIGTYDGFSK